MQKKIGLIDGESAVSQKMKIPQGQHLWATIYDAKNNEKWAITSDEGRLKYNLYIVTNEGWKKVKTAASPGEFEEIVGMRI